MTSYEEPVIRACAGPRVLAVDDRAHFRLLLRKVVAATPEFELVADADCGEQAVLLARELSPDLVLMDVDMPGLGGIEAARRIKTDRPATVVVLISADHPDDLRPETATCLADEIVWKCNLRPALLAQIWQSRRR